jgi:hypothetical protein
MFSVAMGVGCTSTVLLVAKHMVEPTEITMAMVSVVATCGAGILAFLAYDFFVEGLTGVRQ